MTLHIHYQGGTTVPVEVEGVTPDRVAEMSLDNIARMEIFEGNRRRQLAELFRVEGDPTDQEIVWHGDLSGVHWLGAKMTRGRMRIAGPAGRHVGSEMSGGEIHVEGDAGDWVGGEMHGGLIQVQGRAGHLVGAAYRGSARGMTGGTILIHQDAGNEIGHTQRRGLVVIGGNAGDLVGFNMLAGTILVFGQAGIRHGAGMRRGTIGFLSTSPPLLGTFRYACRFRPPFMSLLCRQLRERGLHVAHELDEACFELYHGDLLEGGRGEILLPAR